MKTQAVNDNDVNTKAYLDQFHQENEQLRRDLGIDFYNESKDLVKFNQDFDFNDRKLTNLDSMSVSSNPKINEEVKNKIYVDGELDKNTIVKFNQTIEKYLK